METWDSHKRTTLKGVSEDQLPVNEPMEESEDPDGEHAQHSGNPVEEGDLIDKEGGDENEEPLRPAQSTEESLAPHEEAEYEEPKSNVEYLSESDEEEDDLDDVSPALDNEGEVHSSGYNLRKRKTINYGETRNYKTTATVLYQHGKVSEMSDEFIKRLDEEKPLEPKDMFKRCVGICMNQISAKTGVKKHCEEAVSAILRNLDNWKT